VSRANDEDKEVQRIMLELINQLDGFDARGNVKVIMASNRADTLDPALLRPGRIDRRIEFPFPDLAARLDILKKMSAPMPKKDDIRFQLLAAKTDGFSCRSALHAQSLFFMAII
jgi:ATP-dependent 26S proteasome regulatory subunit